MDHQEVSSLVEQSPRTCSFWTSERRRFLETLVACSDGQVILIEKEEDGYEESFACC